MAPSSTNSNSKIAVRGTLKITSKAPAGETDSERDEASEGAKHKGGSEKGAAPKNGLTRKTEKET